MDHATKYYNMTPIKDLNFWRARPEETWRVYCHPFYTCHGSFCGPFPVSYELNCYPHGVQHCFSTVVDVGGW